MEPESRGKKPCLPPKTMNSLTKFETPPSWLETVSYLLTCSMEKSPCWEANCFASSQETPRVLWNPKVPHYTHKRPPRIPILSQPNPVLTPTAHFLKVYPNIILSSTTGSPQRSLSLGFPHQNPGQTSPFPLRATCPANHNLLSSKIQK
jgi:hypothetical protein